MQDVIPDSLILLDGAMAMDGGSIQIRCVASGQSYNVALDWSIGSRERGCPQLSVDRRRIERGSTKEALWLQLMERAEIRPNPASDGNGRIATRALVLGDDIARYMDAVHRGPPDALQSLVSRLISLVRSPAYQSPQLPVEALDPVEEIRVLVAEGRRTEAIRRYRDQHPDARVLGARDFVDRLARCKQ